MAQVGRHLGHANLFPWTSDRVAREIWDELRADRLSPSDELPTEQALRREAGRVWPSPRSAETLWRYNVTYDVAVDRTLGEYDFYGHADHRAWIWLRPHQPPAESPSREFPFRLVTGPVVEHWGTGTMTRRVPTLHRAVPNAYVEINPDDGRALGIGEGDWVRLSNRRGSLELEARIAHRSQPPRGVLFAPRFDEGALVNLLMRDDACPVSGQPASAECPVRIERVERRT
jgi:nitrate reductase NapA